MIHFFAHSGSHAKSKKRTKALIEIRNGIMILCKFLLMLFCLPKCFLGAIRKIKIFAIIYMFQFHSI